MSGLPTSNGCTATRGGKPLPPTATPAVGDRLLVDGAPFKIVRIVSAGREADAPRSYVLRSPEGREWVVSKGVAR